VAGRPAGRRRPCHGKAEAGATAQDKASGCAEALLLGQEKNSEEVPHAQEPDGGPPEGMIQAVSDSVPGGANHDLTLLRDSHLLDQLQDDEAAMIDKGYVGIRNDYLDKRLYLPFKASWGRPLTEEQKAYNRSPLSLAFRPLPRMRNTLQTLGSLTPAAVHAEPDRLTESSKSRRHHST
jgi:hypothetical protein